MKTGRQEIPITVPTDTAKKTFTGRRDGYQHDVTEWQVSPHPDAPPNATILETTSPQGDFMAVKVGPNGAQETFTADFPEPEIQK